MTSNSEYFRTAAGRLKCILIILIAVTLALSAVGFFKSEYTLNRDKVRPQIVDDDVSLWMEIYLLAASALFLCGTVINLFLYISSRELYWNRRTAIIDFFYNTVQLLLLGTSGMLNIISAVKIFDINCTSENDCQLFEVKLAAGGMGMIAGLISGVIASVVLTNRKDVERDGLID